MRILESDVATGKWRGRNNRGSGLVIFSVGWKVGSEVTGA